MQLKKQRSGLRGVQQKSCLHVFCLTHILHAESAVIENDFNEVRLYGSKIVHQVKA